MHSLTEKIRVYFKGPQEVSVADIVIKDELEQMRDEIKKTFFLAPNLDNQRLDEILGIEPEKPAVDYQTMQFYCHKCQTADSTKCSHWEMNSTISSEKPDNRAHSLMGGCHPECKSLDIEKPKEKTMEWWACPKCSWGCEKEWVCCPRCTTLRPKQKELCKSCGQEINHE